MISGAIFVYSVDIVAGSLAAPSMAQMDGLPWDKKATTGRICRRRRRASAVPRSAVLQIGVVIVISVLPSVPSALNLLSHTGILLEGSIYNLPVYIVPQTLYTHVHALYQEIFHTVPDPTLFMLKDRPPIDVKKGSLPGASSSLVGSIQLRPHRAELHNQLYWRPRL